MPVEAQAAGAPVIAYGVGGAVETVGDGRHGRAVRRAERGGAGGGDRALRGACALDERAVRENAARFGRERFREQLAEVIARASSD